MRLLTVTPASFRTRIPESQYPDLRSLLGNSLPLIVAPDGYRWAVATDGIYPGNQ